MTTTSLLIENSRYIRSLATNPRTVQVKAAAAEPQKPPVYQPGHDVLVSLPSGRPTDRPGVYVNFAHRFAYNPAFTGQARGSYLLGLDGYALPSFGLRYGVTDKLSVSAYQSTTIIGWPIQLMVGYNLFTEQKGSPLNMMVRASIEGQDNFRKNYTEDLEANQITQCDSACSTVCGSHNVIPGSAPHSGWVRHS